MTSGFRKISRVSSLTGGTKWYLSEDCLLAAKRTLYSVEYRRFYLRDLESILVWPSRLWKFRLIPGILIAFLGAYLWEFQSSTAGIILTSIGLAWIVLELALGPTAMARVRTTGASVDISLVKRTRRARGVLDAIDAAVHTTRHVAAQVTMPGLQPKGPPIPTQSDAPSATPSIADASQTNGF